MDHASDWTTWFNIARCLKIWDLDARGFHKSLWRLWLNESHVLIVGCPASPHCAHKSSDVIPIAIQNKVTRPPDWKTLLSGLWLTCRVVSRVSRSLHPKPLLKKIVTLWKRRWREGPWVASFPGFPPRRKPWELGCDPGEDVSVKNCTIWYQSLSYNELKMISLLAVYFFADQSLRCSFCKCFLEIIWFQQEPSFFQTILCYWCHFKVMMALGVSSWFHASVNDAGWGGDEDTKTQDTYDTRGTQRQFSGKYLFGGRFEN